MRGLVAIGFGLWCCAVPAQRVQGKAAAFVPMSPAVQDDRDAIGKMVEQLDAPYSGDADRDFVTRVLAQRRGAIELAKIEMRYGRDAKIRHLASETLAAAHREIMTMLDWLSAHPARLSTSINPRIQWK